MPEDDQQWTPLVPIQPGGNRRPIFICHPTLGVVFPYYELARCLGSDQPVYGLQARGLDGRLDPAASIEEMAGHYIEAVRSVEPTGPYALAGWSSGCFIAFEMARQLEAAGHDVGLVALIDNQAPLEYRTSFLSRDAMPMHLSTMKFLLTTGIRHVWPYVRSYFSLRNAQQRAETNGTAPPTKGPAGAIHRVGRFVTARRGSPHVDDDRRGGSRFEPLTLGPLLRVSRSMVRAIFSYTPGPYPGELTLFRTGVTLDPKLRRDPSLGWNAMTETRTVVEQLPGNHMTIMLRPDVEALADKLTAALDR
jgi:thioesterase domain-containing protein